MATTGRKIGDVVWRAAGDRVDRGEITAIQPWGTYVRWGEMQTSLLSVHWNFHSSWEAAHDELLRRATDVVIQAQDELRRVIEMVEPMAEQQAAEGDGDGN